MSQRTTVYGLVRELGLPSASRMAYLVIALSFAAALLACEDDSGVSGGMDGGVDATEVGVPDASGDAAYDASPDSAPDGMPDAHADTSPDGPGGCSRATIEAELEAALQAVETEVAFAFLLEDDTSEFAFERGQSVETMVRSASTSKWVAATLILWATERSDLSLDSTVGDFFAPEEASEGLRGLTLRSLLSFQSGVIEEPRCLRLGRPMLGFDECLALLLEANAAPIEVGVFNYGSGHLQLAGAMAVRAMGAANITTLFGLFREATGLFPEGRFELPSAENPRLAGGMRWSAREYAAFLRALRRGEILPETTRAEMLSDQLSTTPIEHSPAADRGYNWRYGLGVWLECADAACEDVPYLSSPGAYGAYPFVSNDLRYSGLLAREGRLGTFPEGVAIAAEVRALSERWTACENP